MLLAPSQSPFRRYQAPRVAIVPIERVRPRPQAPVPIAKTAAVYQIPAVVASPVASVSPVLLECLESIRIASNGPPLHIRPLRLDDIIRYVCARYGIDMICIKSARRTGDVVRARQIAMYMAKRLTMRSYPEIGRAFGGRDHTTALHAVQKITRLKAVNPALDAELSEIIAALSPRETA